MISKTLRIRAIGEEQLLLQEMFHPSKQRTARCLRGFLSQIFGEVTDHQPPSSVPAFSLRRAGRQVPACFHERHEHRADSARHSRGRSSRHRSPEDRDALCKQPHSRRQTVESDLYRASHYGPALTRVKHLLATARKSFAGRDHSFRNPTSMLNPSSRASDTRRSSRRW